MPIATHITHKAISRPNAAKALARIQRELQVLIDRAPVENRDAGAILEVQQSAAQALSNIQWLYRKEK